MQGTGRVQGGFPRVPYLRAPQVRRQGAHGRGAGATSWARLRGHSRFGKHPHRGCQGTSEGSRWSRNNQIPSAWEPGRPASSLEERRALRKALSVVLCFVSALPSLSSLGNAGFCLFQCGVSQPA